MAMTEAQKRAALKYQKKLGQISIRLPKDELKRYKQAAEKEGMPFRAWVLSQLKKAAKGRKENEAQQNFCSALQRARKARSQP